MLLWKVILENSFSTASTHFFQPSTYPNTGEFSYQNLSAIRIQFSTFFGSEPFFFPHESTYSYNWNQDSPYDPAKLLIHLFSAPKLIFFSNFGQSWKTTVCFDDIVHFIGEENIMTYADFDRGIINRERKYLPDPVKSPTASQITISLTVLLMRSIPVRSFWTGTVSGTWTQHFLLHSITRPVSTLCPISIPKAQLTNLEQTFICCFLHCDQRTVSETDCALALLSFRKSSYQMDERTKQLLRLRRWKIFGNPEQGMEFHRLWSTAVVLKCRYMIFLFDFDCLLVQCFWCFLKLCCFCSSLFDDFKWEIKLRQQLLWKITFPKAVDAATYLNTLQKFTLL